MVIPPSYCDLGKCANNLFEKGFNSGFTTINVKTKSSNGLEFVSNGSYANQSGKISAFFQAKYTPPDSGLSLVEKWTSDNEFVTEVSVLDKLIPGSKLTLSTTFCPRSGKKSGFCKACFSHDLINACMDINFAQSRPTLGLSAVGWFNGILAGIDLGFDTATSSFAKRNASLGFSGSDYRCVLNVNETKQGMEFGGQLFHSINPALSTAVQLMWTNGQSNARFGVAAKYNIDDSSAFSMKINNVGQLGIAYTLWVNQGVKLTTSSIIEARYIESGGHKFGLGLEFEV